MDSKKTYDWLIVGSGLAGSVFAHEMTKAGKKCLIIDRRSNIGGNCYTETKDGIPIHVWGAHIFHTNSKKVWDWITQFTEFKKYHHQVKCFYDGKYYTFPINLKTLNEINPEIRTPDDAKEYFSQFAELVYDPKYGDLTIDNLESHCIKQIGPDLYEIFVKGYTQKQWGTEPKNLPSRIIKRIPVRTNFDDTYFHNADYCGIPKNGYTEIFEKCLLGIEVKLKTDYLENMEYWDSQAENILYTGPLDEYFGWDIGELEWRSLEFAHTREETEDFQGMSVINYNEINVPFTRIIEHKHFAGHTSPVTWITREYPSNWKRGSEAYYPIADDKNNDLWKQYKTRFEETGKQCAGRLADYKYYDMDQVIGATLSLFEKLKSRI
jgi:UDP-galactopyranose mutase